MITGKKPYMIMSGDRQKAEVLAKVLEYVEDDDRSLIDFLDDVATNLKGYRPGFNEMKRMTWEEWKEGLERGAPLGGSPDAPSRTIL